MRRTKKRFLQLVAIAVVATVRAIAQEGPAPTRRIVVSIPDRKLALIEDGRVVKIYETAVGAPSTPSPTGTFTIVNRIPNPTWYKPGKIVPPGKENPLGTRWLGLSLKGFGIHGTNSPRSIGHARSHGCIRMRNRDVEKLFNLIREGDVVELYEERTEETALIFGVPIVGQNDIRAAVTDPLVHAHATLGTTGSATSPSRPGEQLARVAGSTGGGL